MIRRYNKRRRSAEELLGADYLSQVYLAGMDAMSDTTPITYENRGIDLGSEEEEEEEEEELTEHKPNAEEMYRWLQSEADKSMKTIPKNNIKSKSKDVT